MVMHAWSNASKTSLGGSNASAEYSARRCDDMLLRMEERGASDSTVRPNLVAYVTAIGAWARASGQAEHAAGRAENILEEAVETTTWNVDDVDDAGDDAKTTERRPPLSWSLSQLGMYLKNAHNDAPFNAVITAYARSSDPNAAERALAVIDRLDAIVGVDATTTTHNAVMDACAKRRSRYSIA